MTQLFSNDDPFEPTEDLTEGGTWLLDLVSAVDHLRRGHRPGLTVWDAIAEAINDSQATLEDLPSARFVGTLPHTAPNPLPLQMQTALRRWVISMATRYNSGFHWPHPMARRTFPSPSIRSVIASDSNH